MKSQTLPTNILDIIKPSCSWRSNWPFPIHFGIKSLLGKPFLRHSAYKVKSPKLPEPQFSASRNAGIANQFLGSDRLFNILVPPTYSFSLTAVIASHFLSQLSTADEIIAVRNNNHSISILSDTSGSFRNFVAILDANCFLTSLSTRASHLIL